MVVKAVLHKGVHYFDTDYHRGIRWYRAHFPLRATAALVEGRWGVPAQTFESSPYYLYHPHAGARIAPCDMQPRRHRVDNLSSPPCVDDPTCANCSP